jgi:hypothetical protein
MNQKIDAARLREVLAYCEETGVFTWKVSNSNRAKVGGVAGCIHVSGYRVINVDGCAYKAHRLAWLYVHGEWPVADIDHINGVRDENRIANLRSVTRSVNQQNLRAARGDTNTGVLGVYKTDKKSKPYRSCIKVDGKDRHLGNFPTIELAQFAYLAAKRQVHAGCTI